MSKKKTVETCFFLQVIYASVGETAPPLPVVDSIAAIGGTARRKLRTCWGWRLLLSVAHHRTVNPRDLGVLKDKWVFLLFISKQSRNRRFMDKLKKVLRRKDDENEDGPGILEVITITAVSRCCFGSLAANVLDKCF